jgi:hypothetical protein
MRRRHVSVAVLLAVAALPACHPHKGPAPVTTTASGAPIRLGWITWSDVHEIIYCTRRLDDNGTQIGVTGPCFRQTAGEPPKKIVSWLNAGRPDDKPPNAVPWSRCSVELKGDTQGALATLLTPTTRETLEDWKPDASVGGDVYALELSFSPEGNWLAVVHLAVHLGEGERIIEIPHVDIRPVPACR